MDDKTNPTKALTFSRPWGLLIALGFKPLENRKWQTHFRGRIYIHSAKGLDDLGFTYANRILTDEQFTVFLNYARNLDIPGSIIGEVDIVDCSRKSGSPWAMEGQWHWLLDDPEIYDKPVRILGHLGLWDKGLQEVGL